MADILRAMGIAGAILLGVTGLVIFISFAAVKRGEMAMHGVHNTRAWWNAGGAHVTAGGAIAGKPAAANAGVMEIIILGTVIFGLAIALLIGVSVLQHL